MIYGYARCSTNEERQDIDRQKRELYALGVIEDKYIYWEYESGVKTDRVELQKLLDIVNEGDTIATTEVSRLTRSTKHLCEILQTVKSKHLILDIGDSFRVDNICDFEMIRGCVSLTNSKKFRNIISQRVRSGMKNAAAKGKQIGRPETTKDTIPDKFWKYYHMYKAGSINISEMSRIMSCSRASVYKYIKIAEKE